MMKPRTEEAEIMWETEEYAQEVDVMFGRGQARFSGRARLWCVLSAVLTVGLALLSTSLYQNPRTPRWLPPVLVLMGLLAIANALLMMAYIPGDEEEAEFQFEA